jgi:hypothetical protein
MALYACENSTADKLFLTCQRLLLCKIEVVLPMAKLEQWRYNENSEQVSVLCLIVEKWLMIGAEI